MQTDERREKIPGLAAVHRGMFAPDLAELIFDAAPFEEWEEHHSLREFPARQDAEVKKAA